MPGRRLMLESSDLLCQAFVMARGNSFYFQMYLHMSIATHVPMLLFHWKIVWLQPVYACVGIVFLPGQQKQPFGPEEGDW